MALLPTSPAPRAGDLVWCAFPTNASKTPVPGPWVRSCLIREVVSAYDPVSGTNFLKVHVSYGTGSFNQDHAWTDLLITHDADVRACGLKKPTRISLSPGDKFLLPWDDRFFKPQGYISGQRVIIGSLGKPELDQVEFCLRKRNLKP